MRETKLTPGPWKINKYGSIGAGMLGHTPIVCYVEPFYGEDTRDGDSSANANLLAAAPELYEALDALADITRPARSEWNGEEAYQHAVSIHNRALAALAKARGESEAQS